MRPGPWDALLHAPQRTPTLRADLPEVSREGTKLGLLLGELATVESLPTAALGARCDLDSRQVWGLLKAPRDAGEVRFDAGRWSLAPDFHGRDVQRAAELLRAKGWRVEPPNVAIKPRRQASA